MLERQLIESLLDEAGDPDNPGPRELREIVRRTFVIAVVGLSRDPSKAARRVPSYLAAKGAELIPVNPNADRIFGKTSRDHLDEVTEPVDMVLVFRPSEDAGRVVRDAMVRPERPVIWLQEGIRNDEAAAEARGRGITVVQGICLYKVHRAMGDAFKRVEPPRAGPGAVPGDAS